MTRIIIDSELRDKLLQSQSAEFVDDNGMVLGLFVSRPPVAYPPGVVPPMSDEERQRRLAEPGIYTTEEVFEHLRSL
jgi:hypothetical protein